MDENKVEKILADIDQTIRPTQVFGQKAPQRGVQVYTTSQLRGITGLDKQGGTVHGYYDQSLFFLTLEERIMIFRLCVPVQAVVASRMHTIANMEFDITNDKKDEDRIGQRLKNFKGLYKEYSKSTEPKYLVAKAYLAKEITEVLPDVMPDLSNFDASLIRWKKRNQDIETDKSDVIKEWLSEPNINDRFEEFIKKIVFDLMIHGSVSIYKKIEDNRLENIHLLPGGTILPLKSKYVGGVNAFVQVIHGYDQPQIYFGDEIAYANYIPSTARAYGLVPLEALINMIIETLFFGRLMADQSDGTRPPEKLVIITEQSPFGDLGKEFTVPLEVTEQARIEEKINTPKYGAVMTFSGSGVQVVDLSRGDTISYQMQRQKDIREEVGLIFQATPMEMNLAGGDNTSGRSTSEIQSEMYHSRAVLPIIKIIEGIFNKDILPYRFGSGWKLNYKSGKSDMEDLEILQRKVQTGLFSVNELRGSMNEDPIAGEQNDAPMGASGQQQGQPDGSQINPFNMKQME